MCPTQHSSSCPSYPLVPARVMERCVSEGVFRSVDPPWMAVVAAATGMYLCAVLKTACGTHVSPALLTGVAVCMFPMREGKRALACFLLPLRDDSNYNEVVHESARHVRGRCHVGCDAGFRHFVRSGGVVRATEEDGDGRTALYVSLCAP